MAKLKVKKGEPVYVLKLSRDELEALYFGLNVGDRSRYNSNEHQQLAIEMDDLMSRVLDSLS